MANRPRLSSYPTPTRVSRGSVSKPSDPGTPRYRPQLPPVRRLNRGTVSHPKN
jgi:hypothetical protein